MSSIIKLNELKDRIKNIEIWNYNHLDFNEDNHTYRVYDKVVKSVSKFISPFNKGFNDMMLKKDFREMVELRAKIGTKIHKLTERFDKKDFRKGETLSLSNEEKDLFLVYQMFRKKNPHIKNLAIELPIYSEQLEICGTIDRLLYDYKTNEIILMDIKTGKEQKIHWYQQLIYKFILKELGIKVDKVILLSLKGSGKITKLSDKRKKEEMITTMTNFIYEKIKLNNEIKEKFRPISISKQSVIVSKENLKRIKESFNNGIKKGEQND